MAGRRNAHSAVSVVDSRHSGDKSSSRACSLAAVSLESSYTWRRPDSD